MKIGLHILPVLLVLFFCLGSAQGAPSVTATYLYNLSTSNGIVPCNWVRLNIDGVTGEIYVADSSERLVRVFNEAGMETYTFTDNGEYVVVDMVALENGDLILLSNPGIKGARYSLIRANFRGEFQAAIPLSGIPEDFGEFSPTQLTQHKGVLYLVDRQAMKVLAVTPDGACTASYQLGKMLGLTDSQIRDSGLGGFSVDDRGNMLFTLPVDFKAYVMAPDRTMKTFGSRGSSPGKFNIVSGIVADSRGTIFVLDTLRSVVMIFNSDFSFVTEFGFRGYGPGNLVIPADLFQDKTGRIYVTQGANRGVSVYKISYN